MPEPLIITTYSQLHRLMSEAVREAVRETVDRMSVKSDNSSEWVNTRRLVAELGVSKSTIARWRASGLPYSKASGGVVLYRRSDVSQFIENGKTSDS